MKLEFNQTIDYDGETISLVVVDNQEFDEQLLHDQLLPIFYRVSPALDDTTGRLIPGHKKEELDVGPHFTYFLQLNEHGSNKIIGVEVQCTVWLMNWFLSLLSSGHHCEA